MKFAICNETFLEMPERKPWPHAKAFKLAQECGYTGIEIAPFTIAKDVRDITAEQRIEVRKLAADHGMEVIGLHWLLAFTEGFYLTSPDKAVQQRTTEYMKALAKCCGDMGGTVLVLGSPMQRNLLSGITHEQGMQYAADVLRPTMDAMADNNVVLALEPLGPSEGDFLNTADLGVELMNMIDHPNCRLHLDVKAMSSEAISIPDNIRAHADAMEHFHANDANKLGPGFGEIDFVPIFQALKDVGYDGWVSVEVFDYEPGVERIARESIEYMQKCLTQVQG